MDKEDLIGIGVSVLFLLGCLIMVIGVAYIASEYEHEQQAKCRAIDATAVITIGGESVCVRVAQ